MIHPGINEKHQINPLVSLFGIIAVSVVMVGIAFLVFWNSDSRTIVQSIQRSNQNFDGSPIIASGLDDDNVLSPAELLFIQQNLSSELAPLDAELDFGGQELNKTIIGF